LTISLFFLEFQVGVGRPSLFITCPPFAEPVGGEWKKEGKGEGKGKEKEREGERDVIGNEKERMGKILNYV
jgi:hypothetical protein